MTRRLTLATILVLTCTVPAWSRWDKEDKAYLVDQFRALQEQIQGLKTQLDALGAQVTELKQNQQQLQTVIVRQQRLLQDMDQLVSSLRLGQEENFSGLRATLGEMRAEHKLEFATLTGKPTEPVAGTTTAQAGTAVTPGASPTLRVVQGYITVTEKDNTVTVDLGSSHGMQPGSRLAVYKATDPNTRVGVLEIIQVLDAANSRARVVTMNAGVRPEFSDIVRLE
jgi:TolA-binding protein